MVISGLHTVLRMCGKYFSVTVTKYQHDRLLGRKGYTELMFWQGPVHQHQAESPEA